MKNLYLKIANLLRWSLRVPAKPIKFKSIEYQTDFTNVNEVTGVWYMKRPWGEIHPDNSSGENFWIDRNECKITPHGAVFGMTPSDKYDGTDGKRKVNWACGMVWSKIKFGYGYSEVEVILSDNKGQWSAPLWMFEASAEKTREIDTCEFYIDDKGKRANSAMHFYGDRKSHIANSHKLRDITGRVVRFGVLREPGKASIYYDGHLVRVEKMDSHPEMEVQIGTGMKYINGAQPGQMRVLSFKHGQLR